MKRICYLCLLILLTFLFPLTALAAENQDIKYNINGSEVPREVIGTTQIINQTVYVPLRSISQEFSNLKTEWDNKNKIVSVTNTDNNIVLKLPVGSSIAYKGDSQLSLSTPARNIKGVIYVPLRFISEAFDLYVFWDASTKHIVIYEVDPETVKILSSTDLAEARNAVLKLPKISLQEYFTSDKESASMSNTFYFPYGETKRFIVSDRDLLFYYEVKNNAAWLVWQGIDDENNQNEKDAIPNIVNSLTTEWGKRPDFGNKVSYFFDYHMAGIVRYGIIENGVLNELNEIVKEELNDKTVAYDIPGEVRTD